MAMIVLNMQVLNAPDTDAAIAVVARNAIWIGFIPNSIPVCNQSIRRPIRRYHAQPTPSLFCDTRAVQADHPEGGLDANGRVQ
jgi:hypothetical protein